MARPLRLIELTSPELAALSRKCKLSGTGLVALLPVGSVEQHGPALPLGTDTFLAEESCLVLAGSLASGNPAFTGLVLPALAYTNADSGLGFAGTLSVPHEAQRTYGQGVLETCTRLDVRAIVVVNGHGPNDPWVMESAFRINQDTLLRHGGGRPPLLPISIAGLFGHVYGLLGLPKGKHADWLELCVLRGLRGESLFDGRQEALREHMAIDQPTGFPFPGIPLRARSESGVLGKGWPGDDKDIESLTRQVSDAYVGFLTRQVRESLSQAMDFACPPAWRQS